MISVFYFNSKKFKDQNQKMEYVYPIIFGIRIPNKV